MKFPFFKRSTAEVTELSKANERLLKTLQALEETRLHLVRAKGYEDIEKVLRMLPPYRELSQYMIKRNGFGGVA
jgi:hypothetical protein